MSELPPNIQEFNKVVGLVFAQLYEAFPQTKNLDRAAIAKAMGVSETDWTTHIFPSGMSFAHMLAHTLGWLNAEGFIRSAGGHPAEMVTLTHKGLVALNAVPTGLQQSIGTAVVEGGRAGDLSRIGDLVGGVLGGFTKTIAG
jgi:hypothetical protein